MTARGPYYGVLVAEELSGFGHRALLACGKPVDIGIRTRKFLTQLIIQRR